MANCNNITGFTYDSCESNMGGIKKIWLANYVEDAVVVDSSPAATNGSITAYTSGVTVSAFTEFPMRKNVASMTSTLNVAEEGGTYVTTELNMVFSKMDTQKRLAVVALAQSEAMAIVKDSNNKYWFLGKDNPLTVSAGTGETGTAKADPNHYTVTLTDESEQYPYPLEADLAPDYVAGN